MTKRYAIVRVNKRCPIDTEGFNSFACEDNHDDILNLRFRSKGIISKREY